MPANLYICACIRVKDVGPADVGFPVDGMGSRFADAGIGPEIPAAVVLFRPPQSDKI